LTLGKAELNQVCAAAAAGRRAASRAVKLERHCMPSEVAADKAARDALSQSDRVTRASPAKGGASSGELCTFARRRTERYALPVRQGPEISKWRRTERYALPVNQGPEISK
jgi:hypothetical protein